MNDSKTTYTSPKLHELGNIESIQGYLGYYSDGSYRAGLP